MGEYTFRLTYKTKYVILIELSKLSFRMWVSTNFQENSKNLREQLEFLEEIRSEATLKQGASKHKIFARNDKKVVKEEFEVGNLTLNRKHKDFKEVKLTANMEVLYSMFATS